LGEAYPTGERAIGGVRKLCGTRSPFLLIECCCFRVSAMLLTWK